MFFDFYGAQIQLLSNGNSIHKTWLSKIVSLLIVAIIIVRLVFLILTAIQRKDPQVLYQERLAQNPLNFEITPQNFLISFGIMNNLGQYLNDPALFKVFGYQYTKISSSSFNSNQQLVGIPFNIVNCSNENLKNSKIQEFFSTEDLSKKFCIDIKENDLKIQYDYNSDQFSSIQIHFQKCVGNHCKSLNEIDKILQDIVINASYSDVYFDPTNKDKPFIPFAKDQYWRARSSQTTKVQFYLRNNKVDTDVGWLYSNIESLEFPSYRYDTQYDANLESDTFMKINIQFDRTFENYYQRKYQGVLNILSDIGGFSFVLFVFGAFISTKLSSIHLKLFLISDLFEIKLKKYQQNNENFDNTMNERTPLSLQKSLATQDNPTQQQRRIVAKKKTYMDQSMQNNSTSKLNENFNLQINSENQASKLVRFDKKNITQKPDIKPPQIFFNQLVNPKTELYFQQTSPLTEIISTQNQKYDISNCSLPNFTKQTQAQESRKFDILNILSDSQIKEQGEQYTNFNFSFKDYFFGKLWPFGRYLKQRKVIEASIKKLNQQIDIKFILQKLFELERIKRVLFDSDQIELLKFIPKPSLIINQKTYKSEFEYEISNEFIEKQQTTQNNSKPKIVLDIINRMFYKNHQTEIDKKILQSLDPTFLEQIKQLQYENENNFENQSDQQCQLKNEKIPKNNISHKMVKYNLTNNSNTKNIKNM